MVRYRVSPFSLFRINPKLRFAGTGLDSKFDRYQLFAGCEYAIPTAKVARAVDLTGAALDEILTTHQIEYPVIAKPDCGLFSVGVRLFTNTPTLLGFLHEQEDDYLLQPYIEGGREFSIYYFRHNGCASGHILDLTERILPSVVGDGTSSIEGLIEARQEWEAISSRVKAAYGGDLLAVPQCGETINLAIAASGSGGALFHDSRHLITRALSEAIDRIAVPSEFHLGKFDIKVFSLDDLKDSPNIKLLEINGPLAELNWIWDRRYDYDTAAKAIAAQAELVVRLASGARVHGGERRGLLEILKRARHRRQRVAAIRLNEARLSKQNDLR